MSRFQWMGITFVFIPSIVLLNTIGWTLVLLFMQVKSAYILENEATSIPSVANFFPQIQMDLSRVKWGHGINTKAQLDQSLKGISS